ncbi:MAG: aquaporin [Sphingomonadaceae bacterium]
MTGGLGQRLGAEALGTALLVAAVVGSGIMAERLADGNDAVALLGNTLATAAMLVVLIAMLGPVSGAHFNPAVTLAFTLRGALPPADAAAYAGVQVAGGVAGAMLAHAMFDLPLLMAGTKVRTGSGQWLGEGVATFALVLTILGTLRHRPAWVPLTVAAAITAGYWFTSSTSFANPAVTLARAFTDSFSGIRPIDAPGFVAAQLAGAVLALALARWLFAPDAVMPAPQRPARPHTVIDSPR